MTLLERNRGILARMNSTRPIEADLRRIFVEGKREQLLHGVDAAGSPFAPLKPATVKHRQGSGPPLAPQGPNADIVTRYAIRFETAKDGLVMIASWPMAWVKYAVTGTRTMPRRDPGGFREQDKRAAMTVFREWVMRGRA